MAKHRHKWLPLRPPEPVGQDGSYQTFACWRCLERKFELRRGGSPVYCTYQLFRDLEEWQREDILEAIRAARPSA
jgi:hypothetical protein